MLVVGGGIVGAGPALDAVTRGLKRRPGRAAGPRLRHLVALHQARARRAALPRDVDFAAGQARRWRSAGCCWPGSPRTWCGRCRSSTRWTTRGSGPTSAPASRCTTDGDDRQVRQGVPSTSTSSASSSPGSPRHPDRRPARRDPLLRRPGRRRPAGDDDRPHRRHNGAQVATRTRSPASCGGRAGSSAYACGTWRAGASSRSGPRSSSTRQVSGPTRSRTWSAGAARSTSTPARACTSSSRGPDPLRVRLHHQDREVGAVRDPVGRHWIIGTTDTPWDLDLARPAATRDRHRLPPRARQRAAQGPARPPRRRRASTPACGRCSSRRARRTGRPSSRASTRSPTRCPASCWSPVASSRPTG